MLTAQDSLLGMRKKSAAGRPMRRKSAYIAVYQLSSTIINICHNVFHLEALEVDEYINRIHNVGRYDPLSALTEGGWGEEGGRRKEEERKR